MHGDSITDIYNNMNFIPLLGALQRKLSSGSSKISLMKDHDFVA